MTCHCRTRARHVAIGYPTLRAAVDAAFAQTTRVREAATYPCPTSDAWWHVATQPKGRL